MSDGLSRIELKNANAYRFQDEREEAGLLGTAPDTTVIVPSEGARQYDDEGLLPVMIENGLEKIGLL